MSSTASRYAVTTLSAVNAARACLSMRDLSAAGSVSDLTTKVIGNVARGIVAGGQTSLLLCPNRAYARGAAVKT